MYNLTQKFFVFYQTKIIYLDSNVLIILGWGLKIDKKKVEV